MKKDWKLYAHHILDCLEKIKNIQSRGDITQDEILYDAALRNLQTLSEATRHLPDEQIKKYTDVPWSSISGFRNILVHDYLGEIDAQTIMKVIDEHLQGLENAVKQMLM